MNKTICTPSSNSLTALGDCVAAWDRIAGIPVSYLGLYYPKARYPISTLPQELETFRHLVWDFKAAPWTSENKHRNAMIIFGTAIFQLLNEAFGELLSELTFACVPASCQQSYQRRFMTFANVLCQALPMADGTGAVSYLQDGEASHLGGSLKCEYVLDASFWEGRQVLLFDDIIKSGETMTDMKLRLEHAGAHVVAGLTLGRSVR